MSINENIPLLDWSDVKNVKISPRAKGFMVSPNPVQLHAVGRALAQFRSGNWALLDLPSQVEDANGAIARRIAFQHKDTGEIRHILGYKVLAQTGARFIRSLNADGNLQWAAFDNGRFPTVPPSMSDAKVHAFYSVVVQRTPDGKPELSRSRYHSPYASEYGKIIARQQQEGIFMGDAAYLHPFDLIPKDALLAILLKGQTLAIRTGKLKQSRTIVDDFFRSEWGTRIMGLPYEEVVLE